MFKTTTELSRLMNHRLTAIASLFLLAIWPLSTLAIDWPQEIASDQGTIVIYQPQPEKLEGNVLTGRAAMSLEMNDSKEPIFGAFWFTATIDTDSDAGIAIVRDVKVQRVKWADSTDAGEQRFTALVEGAVPKAGFETSLDLLSASLATAEQEQKSLDNLKNDPPEIMFSDQLAVLLAYDGTPRFSPVENSDYERALNVPFLVVRNTRTKQCYLSNGTLWYQSRDPLGPWQQTTSPPADLVKMLPAPETDEPAMQAAPTIVVATRPTELVSTDGKAKWVALTGGDLLYVSNTETPWLRELSTQNMYILLSGRWYRSKNQDGPWTFVRPDELPASFSDIPPASDIGGLRVSVAGTEEAEQAMMDAQIPQTAAIKRSEASLTVEYDGAPKFEPVTGTKVSYAVNTGAQVLEIGGRYYAVDNGVWFTSASATGPWIVADSIPSEEISQIPPSSPVYNTTYVTVYKSTPEVVYVGYTPGYLWSYPYYGVPVYGTGWYYPPYWGRYYYPRPPTWGLHVGYNPWTGWNFGVSWSNGFFTFGVSWGGGWGGAYRPWGCCGGWYGGGYHRSPVFINNGNINIGNSINIGNRGDIKDRFARDNNFNRDNNRSGNLYNRPENRVRNADKAAVSRDFQKAKPSNTRANDVFTDRDGNVARRSDNGWETRDKGSWKPAENPAKTNDRVNSSDRSGQRPSTTPSTRPSTTPSTRPSTTMPSSRPPSTTSYNSPSTSAPRQLDQSGLNRAYSARQSGASRQMSRPANPGSRPANPGRRR